MDCLSQRASEKPIQSLESPSPIMYKKIDLLVERLLDERLKAMEPKVVARIQNGCFNALFPELMARAEQSCHEMLRSLEPEVAWRVQLAVSSKLAQAEKQKVDNQTQLVKVVAEPAPEPNALNASLIQDMRNSRDFQDMINSSVQMKVGDRLHTVESDVREFHNKLAEWSASLTQLQEETKAFGVSNELLSEQANPQPRSRWRELSTTPTEIESTNSQPHSRWRELSTPRDNRTLIVPSISEEIHSRNVEEYSNFKDTQQDIIQPPPVTPVPPQSEVLGSGLPNPHEKYPAHVSMGAPEEEGEKRGDDKQVEVVGAGEVPVQKFPTYERQSQFQQDRVRHSDAYRFEESVWEMIIVFRTGWTSWSGDVQLAFAFIINVILQSYLAIIIWKTFSSTEDMDVDVPSLEKWRVTSAHNYLNVDDITQETLVSRVCRSDATLGSFTNYIEMLNDIDVYNQDLWPFSVGSMLCCIVVLIWVFTVVEDALDSSSFLHGILCLPRALRSKVASTSEDEYGVLELEFEAISPGRVIFACFVCAVRFAISIIFLFVGCKWLAHTYDFADLLLNSVALAFVFRLDELCFEVLAPIDVVTVCDVLKPLPLGVHMIKGWGICPNINSSDLSRIPLLLASFIFFAYICIDHIEPRTKQLRAAADALCGGKRNFAIGFDSRTTLLYTAPTILDQDEDNLWPTGIPAEIPLIKSLTDDSNYLIVPGVAHMESVADISENTQMYIHTFVTETYFTCEDRISDAAPYVLPTLQRHNSNPSATTCEGLKNDCFHVNQLYLRMNCPVSCGATSPRSGLFLTEPLRGIPGDLCRATQQYQDEFNAIPCSDLSKAELDALPGWARAWDLMVDFWDSRSTANRLECYKSIRTMFLADGCGGVAKLQNLACIADDHAAFCNGVRDVLNVAHFCPVACGCVAGTNHAAACPPSCVVNSTR